VAGKGRFLRRLFVSLAAIGLNSESTGTGRHNMHLWYFVRWCWEHLLLWSKWLAKDEGIGDLVGAITIAVVLTAATIGWSKRSRLQSWASTICNKPVRFALVLMPFVAFILLCSAKYLPVLAATATSIGVVVALVSLQKTQENNSKTQEHNRATQDREEKRFQRQAKAARSALGLELSNLCDYCDDVAKLLMNLGKDPLAATPWKLLENATLPQPPVTVTATLKEMITSTKEQHIADRCALLLHHVQIVKANVRTLKREQKVMSPVAWSDMKIRVAVLAEITTSLFNFARYDELELEEISWEAIDQASTDLKFSTEFEFIETFKNNRDSFASPLHMYGNVFREYKPMI
jgi:Ca2+/Na+ antiporter